MVVVHVVSDVLTARLVVPCSVAFWARWVRVAGEDPWPMVI